MRDLGDSRDPVASVHVVLARYEAGWTLIFDNAADLTSVAAFASARARAGADHLHNQNWPHGQALQVPVLGQQAAVEFLVKRTGDADRQTATELAGQLGALPLALEQAAAYLQATGDSLAEYQASFQQRRPAVLSRGEPTGYRGTVATTWELAFSRLERFPVDREAGDPAAARDQYAALLPVLERVLGSEHSTRTPLSSTAAWPR